MEVILPGLILLLLLILYFRRDFRKIGTSDPKPDRDDLEDLIARERTRMADQTHASSSKTPEEQK